MARKARVPPKVRRLKSLPKEISNQLGELMEGGSVKEVDTPVKRMGGEEALRLVHSQDASRFFKSGETVFRQKKSPSLSQERAMSDGDRYFPVPRKSPLEAVGGASQVARRPKTKRKDQREELEELAETEELEGQNHAEEVPGKSPSASGSEPANHSPPPSKRPTGKGIESKRRSPPLESEPSSPPEDDPPPERSTEEDSANRSDFSLEPDPLRGVKLSGVVEGEPGEEVSASSEEPEFQRLVREQVEPEAKARVEEMAGRLEASAGDDGEVGEGPEGEGPSQLELIQYLVEVEKSELPVKDPDDYIQKVLSFVDRGPALQRALHNAFRALGLNRVTSQQEVQQQVVELVRGITTRRRDLLTLMLIRLFRIRGHLMSAAVAADMLMVLVVSSCLVTVLVPESLTGQDQ